MEVANNDLLAPHLQYYFAVRLFRKDEKFDIIPTLIAYDYNDMSMSAFTRKLKSLASRYDTANDKFLNLCAIAIFYTGFRESKPDMTDAKLQAIFRRILPIAAMSNEEFHELESLAHMLKTHPKVSRLTLKPCEFMHVKPHLLMLLQYERSEYVQKYWRTMDDLDEFASGKMLEGGMVQPLLMRDMCRIVRESLRRNLKQLVQQEAAHGVNVKPFGRDVLKNVVLELLIQGIKNTMDH